MTIIKIIFISGLVIIIQSCLPYTKVDKYDNLINVNDIKEHKQLNKAIKTDYVAFFNKMINEKYSKLVGNNWEIFLNDSSNVYYGYGMLTKKGIYADTIYSTSKSELEKQFPLYDIMSFRELRAKLLDYAYRDFGYDHKITYAKDSIFMTSKGILINTERKYKIQFQKQLRPTKGQVHYEILVNRLNLEMITRLQKD